MGMQSGKIKDQRIFASSEFSKNYRAQLARLNHQRRGANFGAWSAKYNNRYQFLQVDLGHPSRISRIFTQGRADTRQWVTKYKVQYSQDGVRFTHQKYNSNIKVRFTLNW